ncbi:WD40 repeat protein [Pedobacter psychrotolerans]|uniref:Cell envelope biogenesis protein OmpA n=1 Tax=Pedobacter psychrotolerans TaxID=1843235 RepID=A0A4R2HAD9_9SPHI|nr:OmpA family protein [Pedobacter psychrotolerans]TCO23695.1 WD40 repeat protein [Pedobacter psychrotolerans]GGE61897.1 cell envelope biogenesis protein OmpA [Pedobacter psychrotolerans]
MRKILLFLLLAVGGLAKAQYVVNYKRVADTYFENRDYYAASTFYKKALRITGDSTQAILPYGKERKGTSEEKVIEDYEGAIYNLAESSRLYREFAEAEKYYAIAITFTNTRYRRALFYYAESLRANKKFDRAITNFESFISKNPSNPLVKDAQKEIASCKFAMEEMRFPRMVQVKRAPANVNGLGSNYAPVKVDQSFYFTSSRPINVAGKRDIVKTETGEVQVSTKANPFLNTLYTAKNELTANEIPVKMMNLNLPKNMEVAAASFSPDGNTVYFTGWKEKSQYSIYTSKKNDDKWAEPQPVGLEVNSKDFNSLQPFVTRDGKFLLFASDRTGGYGKLDLWFCAIRSDGSLGQPVNLGPTINTEDDERAPYYNPFTKKLIFSTDGRIGLGGLDFFESEGDLVTWSEPKNIGYPFNSSKDDLYFTSANADDTKGYISSDRESSCCLEVFEIKKEFFSINGILTDCKTKLPMADATVTFTNAEGTQKAVTGIDGKYDFRADSKRPVKLSFSKENYFSIIKNYVYEELAKADTMIYKDYCLSPFKMGIPIAIDNVYYEFNSAELTEPSKKVLDYLIPIMEDNPDMEIELGSHTDNVGTDEYNLELSNKRAQSCVDYLASKGIASSRMTSKGYGESTPIASNEIGRGKRKKDNPDGRAKNRRTEFKVTKK